ncbi:phosphoribosyltransferase family protein [Desulfocurvus sp. DL9XJH121]
MKGLPPGASWLLRLLGGRCHACGAVVRGAGRGPLPTLCPACEQALAPRTGGFCPRCGAVASDPLAGPTVCGDCRRDPPPWEALYFHGVYAGRLKSLLADYKFNDRLGLGGLVQALALAAWERGGAEAPDLVAPVPLHPRRLLSRGFNQSLEAARLLARRLDRPLVPRALARVRHTAPQMSLDAARRRENVRGAFAAEAALVKGARVLLVDDVMTTGGTLRECAGALRRAGAGRVEALVLARTAREA